MKKSRLYFIVLFSVLVSCNSDDRKPAGEPENDIDAARTFIRAALDGDYEKAGTFLLDDTINMNYIEVRARLYRNMSKEDRDKYRGASIHIHETKKVNDSTTIVYYSNSFRNLKDSLKVIRMKGKWLVDFKYTFDHKPDTLQ